MKLLFLEIINMSIRASYVIGAVLILRFILKKAPKSYRIFLWGIVAFRLFCPFSFESIFSMLPTKSEIYIPAQTQTNIPSTTITTPTNMNSGIEMIDIFLYVWIIGMILLFVYSMYSYFRLKKQTITSIEIKEDIYICDTISSPFILGIIHPRIFLPSTLDDIQKEIVIQHEQTHIRRMDYIWKPLGYALLTLHWFNPLVWIAYITLCKDIEFICDEKTIEQMNSDEKRIYTSTLLECSIQRYNIMACPVAFGEIGVKERIAAIFNYRKPTFWILFICICICIGSLFVLGSNPVEDKFTSGIFYTPDQTQYIELDQENNIFNLVYSHDKNEMRNGSYHIEDHKIVCVDKETGFSYTWEIVDETTLKYIGSNTNNSNIQIYTLFICDDIKNAAYQNIQRWVQDSIYTSCISNDEEMYNDAYMYFINTQILDKGKSEEYQTAYYMYAYFAQYRISENKLKLKQELSFPLVYECDDTKYPGRALLTTAENYKDENTYDFTSFMKQHFSDTAYKTAENHFKIKQNLKNRCLPYKLNNAENISIIYDSNHNAIAFLVNVKEANAKDISTEVVECSRTEITIKFTNNSDYDYMFSEKFTLYKKKNNKMEAVDFRNTTLVYNDILNVVEAHDSIEKTYKLSEYYPTLSSGNYCIEIKDLMIDFSIGSKETSTMKAVVEKKYKDYIVITNFENYKKYNIEINLSNYFDIKKLEEGDCVIITTPKKYIIKEDGKRNYIPIYDIEKNEIQYSLMYDVEGNLIHVLSGNDTFAQIYNSIKPFDCGITDINYKNEVLCTHPRGVYGNQDITITLVSEPHIHMTYRIDLYNAETSATSRIYVKEEKIDKILEIIKNADIPYIKEA